MDKSYVGMGIHVCPVCGVEHDEVVLLEKQLRNSLTQHEFVGWKLCLEHQEKFDEGYIALIECTNQPSGLANAKRTGGIAHVRAEVWPHLFDTPVPEQGICFVETGVLQKLQERVGHNHGLNKDPRTASSRDSTL